MLGAHRARSIAAGAPLLLERDEDKNPVVALREIAEGAVKPELLREDAIKSQQKHVEVDEPVEDNMAVLMGEGDSPDGDLSEEELIRALQAEAAER